MKRAELVYKSMMGELVAPCPEIPDAFADGTHCAELYGHILAAGNRICEKLGVREDPDVELMINTFLKMNRELCGRMYHYGLWDGKTDAK
ncbi:MAG: hypothetical protein IJ960_05810 [Oscillospiraceae bacterium]|nr:hypothetical protein [Oscillospiraceae bacterium]